MKERSKGRKMNTVIKIHNFGIKRLMKHKVNKEKHSVLLSQTYWKWPVEKLM